MQTAQRLARTSSGGTQTATWFFPGGKSFEEVIKHVWNSLAVQLDDRGSPEHDNARSGCSTRSIEARKGSAAETAAEKKSEARKEAAHSTAGPAAGAINFGGRLRRTQKIAWAQQPSR
jgi:hypothetical protein